MRLNVLCIASILAIVSPLSSSRADRAFLTGNVLYSMYTSDPHGFTMYSVAIADALATATISGFRACIAYATTMEQISDIVINYLRAHPERRQLSANSLVASALSEAFPCR
jgi:hypothetical protein